jgi:hypothetical protein
MIGAAKLDSNVFREIEHDRSANLQAAGVVVLVSLATAIGGARDGVGGFVFGLIVALGGWLIASAIVLFIGTRVLPEPQTEADWGQTLRCMAFAYSPGVLRIFAVIPFLGGIVLFGTWIWMLIATIVAVQEALDYRDTWRAPVVVLLGWLVYVALQAVYQALVTGFR